MTAPGMERFETATRCQTCLLRRRVAKARALKPKASRAVWRCQSCGHSELKWLGRCPTCQEWSSLIEEIEAAAPPRPSAAGVADGAAPVAITDVLEISARDRRTTGIRELDRVLGGGMVAGCLVLLGGDPGVGKSTLLIQALAGLAGRGGVLYATGEESVALTAMRARRVGAATAALTVVAETDVERILAHAQAHPPACTRSGSSRSPARWRRSASARAG